MYYQRICWNYFIVKQRKLEVVKTIPYLQVEQLLMVRDNLFLKNSSNH